MFDCLFFLVFALLVSACVIILYGFYLLTNFNDNNPSTGSTLFHIHASIDKHANFLQSNNSISSKNLWLLFQPCFYFWKFISIKWQHNVKAFFNFICLSAAFSHKHIKTPDQQEAIRSCSICKCFTSDFIGTCGDIESLITQLTIDHYSVSKVKYQSLNSFSHFAIVSCLKFIWITNSRDHWRVWTGNPLHTK